MSGRYRIHYRCGDRCPQAVPSARRPRAVYTVEPTPVYTDIDDLGRLEAGGYRICRQLGLKDDPGDSAPPAAGMILFGDPTVVDRLSRSWSRIYLANRSRMGRRDAHSTRGLQLNRLAAEVDRVSRQLPCLRHRGQKLAHHPDCILRPNTAYGTSERTAWMRDLTRSAGRSKMLATMEIKTSRKYRHPNYSPTGWGKVSLRLARRRERIPMHSIGADGLPTETADVTEVTVDYLRRESPFEIAQREMWEESGVFLSKELFTRLQQETERRFPFPTLYSEGPMFVVYLPSTIGFDIEFADDPSRCRLALKLIEPIPTTISDGDETVDYSVEAV